MISRNTIQRQLVLDAVRSMTNHPTVDEIYARITQTHPSISKGTVYRNLNLLAEQGEILRIQIPNAADRYDFRIQRHYHLRCQRCGHIFDVTMAYQEHLEEKIENPGGFTILSHDIIFSGICPDCQASSENGPV